MESKRIMLLHALVIGVLLYVFMVYVLGQSKSVAESRSILLAAIVLIYMVLFGHNLPSIGALSSITGSSK